MTAVREAPSRGRLRPGGGSGEEEASERGRLCPGGGGKATTRGSKGPEGGERTGGRKGRGEGAGGGKAPSRGRLCPEGEAPSRGRLRRGGGSGEGKSASWRDCRALMICDASLQSETLILTPTVEILTVSLSLVRECMRQARTLTRIHLHCLPLTPVVLSWSDFIAFIDEFTIQLVRLILEQDSCVPL